MVCVCVYHLHIKIENTNVSFYNERETEAITKCVGLNIYRHTWLDLKSMLNLSNWNVKIVGSGNGLGDVAAGYGRDEGTSGFVLDLEAADKSIEGERGR